MDAATQSRGAAVLKAYVRGDASEPDVLSAFRDIGFEDRGALVLSHRRELDAIDPARQTILESLILPLDERAR